MRGWLVIVVALLCACSDSVPTNYDVLPRPPPEGWGQVRILDVAADMPSLDVYLRDLTEPVLSSLAVGFAQGFLELAARDYTVDLRLAAASPYSEVLASFDISLQSRERVTLVLAGTPDDAMLVRFADDLARIDLGAVRVVNATTTGPVSFDFDADGSTEVAALAVGAVGRATLPDLAPRDVSVSTDSGAQTYRLPERPTEGDVVIVAADTTTLMLTYSFTVDLLTPP